MNKLLEPVIRAIIVISFILLCSIPIGINMIFQNYKIREDQEYRRSYKEVFGEEYKED